MIQDAEAVRSFVGAQAALTPARTAARQLGRGATAGEAAVVAVLGARQLAQAVITSRTRWRMLGAGVDLLHGTSMLVLAAVAPRRYGRAALLQAATAAVLIALELAAQRVDARH